ncbi:HD domain-containing protein [Planctomycetota bacterium]
MKECKLPTQKKCFEIINEHHVPLHIIRHCLAVAKLAVFLAKRLKEKNISVNVELVERTALLHDIARVCDFKKLDYNKFNQTVMQADKAKWEQLRVEHKGIYHEEAAYQILKARFPTLALVIKKHRYIGMLDKEDKPKSWEEKLVFYADMRIMHDKITPLKQRLEEGHKRNVHFHGSAEQSRINTAKVDPLIFKLEEEIFAKIGLEPLEVTDEFIDTFGG